MQIQIRFLRLTGIAEGVSFLVLLLIAMPLKYFFELPMAVKVAGWFHGILFMMYILAVISSVRLMKWNFWSMMVAGVASLVPLGTFILDKGWRKREQELLSELSRKIPVSGDFT